MSRIFSRRYVEDAAKDGDVLDAYQQGDWPLGFAVKVYGESHAAQFLAMLGASVERSSMATESVFNLAASALIRTDELGFTVVYFPGWELTI